MIEKFLENSFASSRFDDQTKSESVENVEQEAKYFAALPVVRKILRRRTAAALQTDKNDLFQTIALQLWGWRTRHPVKSREMSESEWASFAARSAFNEVNRQLPRQKIHEPLEVALNIAVEQNLAGNSAAEVRSLGAIFWQSICNLTVRQRRALLLHSDELIVDLTQSAIADEMTIMEMLDLDFQTWQEVSLRLPLTDSEIADLPTLQQSKNTFRKVDAAKSIKKARHEARVKLRRLLNR